MMLPELQTLAQIFAERLLNTAAEGILVAGLVWVLLRLVPRQNSGTRFALWFGALLAIVALPFFSASSFAAAHFATVDRANGHARIVLSTAVALSLFIGWALGAGLLLLRLGLGLWRVQHFRRSFFELDPSSLAPAIAGIVRDFKSGRKVKLCVSKEATVPAAIGFFRPAIVFPAWLLPQLSADEIKLILLHELAHLRRWDDWTNLAQKIVKALFFFHPAVWWIESRLTLEREMACDDMVLAEAASPHAYASSLISFAEKLHDERGLALAQALVSRMHQMSARVAQILDSKRPSRTSVWKPILGLSSGMLALVLGSAPFMPRVVAFENAPKNGEVQRRQAAKVDMPAAAMIQPAAAQSSEPASQFRVIPAVFHPRVAAIPLRLKVAPRKPTAIHASAPQQEVAMQETIFVLRTTRFDASGSGVWTLCVWRVGGTNQAERQLETAIVLGLI